MLLGVVALLLHHLIVVKAAQTHVRFSLRWLLKPELTLINVLVKLDELLEEGDLLVGQRVVGVLGHHVA